MGLLRELYVINKVIKATKTQGVTEVRRNRRVSKRRGFKEEHEE